MQETLPLIPQLLEFQNSPREERQSHYDHTKAPRESMDYYAGLKERLAEIGIPVEEADIDPLDFEAWLAEFPEIKSYYQGMETSLSRSALSTIWFTSIFASPGTTSILTLRLLEAHLQIS